MLEQLLKFETEVKSLSDAALVLKLERIFAYEKKCGDAILLGLKEIKVRRLFISAGYASLFAMLVNHFKLSETMAYSRLSALKLIEAVPAAQTALFNNEVNLATLAEVQSFINKTEKASAEKMPASEKEELVNEIIGKTLNETKAFLGDKNPALALPVDRQKTLTSELTLLQVKLDAETMGLLNEVKSLLSHKIPDGNYNEVLKFMAQAAVDQLKRKKGIQEKKTESLTDVVIQPVKNECTELIQISPVSVNPCVKQSRYISAKVKKIVFKRANGCCEHVHPNGSTCASKFQLEFDHVLPFSHGGNNELANLILRCRAHNSYRTKETHGFWYKGKST